MAMGRRRASWVLGGAAICGLATGLAVVLSGPVTTGGPRDLSADQARVATHVAGYAHQVNGHDQALLHAEHQAMLELAPNDAVSAVALVSGPWSDAQTWYSRRVPDRDAQVLIPEGIEVVVDQRIDTPYGWLRVDGSLRFSTQADTILRAQTILVTESGSLTIGSAVDPVAPDRVATIEFLARSQAARLADSTDLAGGLITHGEFQVNGSPKVAYAIPQVAPGPGQDRVELGAALHGWRVGDELLFADPNWGTENDEIRTIAAIDGRVVELDRPLDHDHSAAGGIDAVPVANLTRNVRFTSADTVELGARGHVMVMHRHEPVSVNWAAFVGLGRTDATTVHTVPTESPEGGVVPGTDANTIGRYPLHFHMRTGALADSEAHRVTGVVIAHSPKHGLVNHGGHVVATENIGFDNAGAHFFTENGTELGVFEANLAVRSTGSGALIRDRDAAQDFGHQGHGFWMQSAAVELRDNWAIGHAGMGIVLFGYPQLEGGEYLYFPSANVSSADRQPSKAEVSISDISFRYVDNTVLASLAGLEVWVHKLDSVSGARSVVDGLRVADVAYQGINIFYAKDIDLRRLELDQATEHPTGIGIGTNTMAENIHIEDASIANFAVGYVAPTRGINSLQNATLANSVNLQIAPPTKAGRYLAFSDVSFSPGSESNVEMQDLRVPVNGDLSLLLSQDHLYLVDDRSTQRLFFPSQHRDAMPFSAEASSQFGDLTSGEMFERFGIAVGGAVAPLDAVWLESGNALVADVAKVADQAAAFEAESVAGAGLTEAQAYTAKFRLQYPGAWENFRLAEEVGLDPDGAWSVDATARGAAVFADDEPPLFILRPSLADLRIHPDDVAFGYRVDGQVYDRVGEFISVRAFTQDFRSLEVVEGRVQVDFTIHDMAGNALPVTLDIEVSTEATRRLGNLSFFNELDTGLSEIDDMNAEAMAHFGDTYTLTSEQN